MKKDTSFSVFHRNDNHSLVGLVVIISMFLFPSMSHAGVLFSSSWNTATGTSKKAITDGGTWDIDWGKPNKQGPKIESGGPGGNNYLVMVTVGDEGWGSPHYMNWFIHPGSDIFGDPDNLYIQCYFRVDSSWTAVWPMKHWFMGIDNTKNTDTKHYLCFQPISDEFPGLKGDFQLRINNYGDGEWSANVPIYYDTWYRYEIHIHKVNPNKERWYIRLDGVDITDKYKCTSNGNAPYGAYLDHWYDGGGGFTNEYHGNLWLATYDMPGPLNDGWDVCCIEVRDDTWPRPVE
jgi:hypothetical protein